jgi:hypothetical protein
MKILKDVPATAKKKRRITVELQHDDEVLMSFRPNQYYKMGEPTEDIVQGYAIIGAWPTDWCSIAQEWQI